ncbi:hypothetical protein WHT83_06195 [Aminobacter sp. P9b]|uniref:hypothetical protein n=1 Tax=Aminobacter sp. P9b TaxID=3133697 RepID=UPI00325327FC
MDRSKFYAALRARSSGVFGTSLTTSQVANLEAILDEIQSAGLPLRHAAYVLATPYHEVGSAMAPKVENLTYSSAERIKAVWPQRFPRLGDALPYVRNPQGLANKVYGGRMGNVGPNDGWTYRGRGYPQTTGRENYERFGKLLGLDLLGNPDLALQPGISARILILGMKGGLFTGKKLADFLNGDQPNYRGARAIINGDVEANGDTVAGYAVAFANALRAAAYIGVKAPPLVIPPEPSTAPKPSNPKPSEPIAPPPGTAPGEPAKGFRFVLQLIAKALAALFSRKEH